MHVRRLELVDFRSYSEVAVDLEPGPCVLVGQNGVGKTNLVEALYYVATLSSHRVATDAPLVRAGAGRAVIRAAVVSEGRELLIELSIEPGKANRARLGRAPLPRTRDLVGVLRTVLFAPEDLSLVRGDPDQRRRFMDDLLVARQPRYAGVRADYDRVLKQRNALLRSAYLARRVGGTRPDLSTLDVWDLHLARVGSDLLAGRLELAASLVPHLTTAYRAVSYGGPGRDCDVVRDAGLRYVAARGADPARLDVPIDGPRPGREELEAALGDALARVRRSEIERGTTLVGPHRDDLVLSIGELPAKGYASHGEAWSFALALKLASYELLRAAGIEPVLVLDDVFSELDAGRRERLAELVCDASQVLVTCAVDADVPRGLRGVRFSVSDRGVRRV
jgi:DNA replication and repair protein RecF